MKVNNVLSGISRRGFNDDFFSDIRSLYKGQVENGIFKSEEREFNVSLPILRTLLPAEHNALLDEYLTLYEDRRTFCAKFAFLRGVYGAFRQHFSEDIDGDGGFTEFILNDLMMRRKKTYPGYTEKVNRCNAIYDEVMEVLSGDGRDHWTAMECTLAQREYSATYHGFYCGYCAAYDIIEHAKPLVKTENIGTILSTEYFLGFTRPYRDIEDGYNVADRQKMAPPKDLSSIT